MTWSWAAFVIWWLVGSGLLVFYRGAAGTVKRYSMVDAVLGVAEIAFLIWIVAARL